VTQWGGNWQHNGIMPAKPPAECHWPLAIGCCVVAILILLAWYLGFPEALK